MSVLVTTVPLSQQKFSKGWWRATWLQSKELLSSVVAQSFSMALSHLARGKAAYVSVTLPLRAAGSGAKAQVIFGKVIGQVPFQPLPWNGVVLDENIASFGEAWEPVICSGKRQKPLDFCT